MKIVVNNKELEVNDSATVLTAIDQLELKGKRIAVERNEEIVPRSEHATTTLNEGDQLEIVHAIGGG